PTAGGVPSCGPCPTVPTPCARWRSTSAAVRTRTWVVATSWSSDRSGPGPRPTPGPLSAQDRSASEQLRRWRLVVAGHDVAAPVDPAGVTRRVADHQLVRADRPGDHRSGADHGELADVVAAHD